MTTSVVDNGVNVEALLGAREAFADTPEIAQFQWRSTVSWVNGTHSRSDVETFYGFGEEQRHRTTFSFDIDHPLQFAAQDNGDHAGGVRAGRAGRLPDRGHRRGGPAAADPAAVGAGHRRRGDGPARHPRRRPGRPQRLQRGRGRATGSTPTPPPEEIEALVAQSQKRSAVYDILTNPTSVTVDVS